MIKVECIRQLKDKHNKIVGYLISDSNGNKRQVTSDQLKQAIRNNQVQVINLTLTSDDRLIRTKTQEIDKQIKQYIDTQSILDKSKLLGFKIEQIPTAGKLKCYLISESDTEHILLIPSNVKKLNSDEKQKYRFTKSIKNLQGTIKVIGGSGLKDTIRLFECCQMQSLDLSAFDTSNVTDMRYMFNECKVKSIDFSNFDTSKVIYMGYMFSKCDVQSLDLSSFDTSNVEIMTYMFGRCKAKHINVASFDTSKVKIMNSMFYNCEAQSLDLSSFDTRNVIDMESMFYGCKAKYIDIYSFNACKAKVDLMFCCWQNTARVNDKKIIHEINNEIERVFLK